MNLRKQDAGVWVKASEELPEIYERIPIRGSNNIGFVVTGFFDGKVFWRLEDDKRNYPIDRKITEWLKPVTGYLLTEDELKEHEKIITEMRATHIMEVQGLLEVNRKLGEDHSIAFAEWMELQSYHIKGMDDTQRAIIYKQFIQSITNQ